jgi:hypothetical protein
MLAKLPVTDTAASATKHRHDCPENARAGTINDESCAAQANLNQCGALEVSGLMGTTRVCFTRDRTLTGGLFR